MKERRDLRDKRELIFFRAITMDRNKLWLSTKREKIFEHFQVFIFLSSKKKEEITFFSSLPCIRIQKYAQVLFKRYFLS